MIDESRSNPQGGRLKDWNQKIFLIFLDLESGNDQRKEEDVCINEINGSNASKLHSKIENP